MRRIAVFAIFAIFVLAAAPIASVAGRPVATWTTDQLWRQADVVIIGMAQASASPALPGAKPNTWTPVRTTFSIGAALKGHVAGKSITLSHFRYHSRQAEIGEIDGPGFVSFDTAKKAEYLLFLKSPRPQPADAPVEYEPLTGQMDPGTSFSRLVPVAR